MESIQQSLLKSFWEIYLDQTAAKGHFDETYFFFFKVKFSQETYGSVLMNIKFPLHILKLAEDAEYFPLMLFLSSSMPNIDMNLM